MSIFDFFKSKKKPSLSLKPRQSVEIEFFSDENGYESHFTQILDVQRKKVIVKSPGTERRPIRMLAGQKLVVTTLDGNTLFDFDSNVLDAGEREFDISAPEHVREEQLPPFDANFSIEVPVRVEYRAMKSAHNQVANTYSLTPESLTLISNIPIPPGTDLHLEIEIPGVGDYSCKARATGGRKHPTDDKKHLSDIEYIDLDHNNCLEILRYAVYAKRRLQRQAEHEAMEGQR